MSIFARFGNDFQCMQIRSFKFLLVITVKPSNIEIKTIQWNKSRNWDMKGGKYTKIFAKIQVNAIFHMRDIRRNFVPKFVWRRHVSAHPDGTNMEV